ncbi:MAG: alanine racemase [Candidatus Omnitrophica bacterium]|nr:alanine racemase [Candidatus Omnitrophota bacterium]
MKGNYIGYRPTWAEINLKNLEYNFFKIRKRVSEATKIMVTIKADAYGHGLIPVAKTLENCGVDYFGVASIDEGIKLREFGIKPPVLILGLILKKDIGPLFKYNLVPTVCDEELPKAINKRAKALNKRVNVHIKVDTGMGRIGIHHYDAHKLVFKISRFKNINIEGLFTHFALADLNKEFTFHQIALFDRLVKRLSREAIRVPFIHAANSMGILDYKNSHFNMVRPGLIVYGLYPRGGLRIDLKPVLSLKTKVVYLKKVSAGVGISYGHDYVTKKTTKIATLPIGYGDGYPRNLSNKAEVLIAGRRFKIAGRICMDQIMVDIGGTRVKVGDEVVLIGVQGKEKITSEELALKSGTIPYEIVCGLGSRIPRIYNP